MRVRLTQLDGKLPNLALMKLAHYHRARGDEPYLRHTVYREFWDNPEIVYGSAIFSYSADRVAEFRAQWPNAIVGGTHNLLDNSTVEQVIGESEYEHYDYSIYPKFNGSIGFTARGCRLKCGFCVVPKKEGKPRSVNTIADIWRGQRTPQEKRAYAALSKQEKDEQYGFCVLPRKKGRPGPKWEQHPEWADEWPRHLHILDNDFFGQVPDQWQARMEEIRGGNFKLCLNQGINVRMIDEQSAAALGSVPLFDDGFSERRLYTAWDNIGDEQRFFRGVDTLERHGIKPSCLLVYMLCGYAKDETWEKLLYRFNRMKDRGILPYPMVYGERNRVLEPSHPTLGKRSLADFQRWAIRKYYTVVTFEEYDPASREKLVKIDGKYRIPTDPDLF